MLKINEDKFIEYYKQLRKYIKLAKALLKDSGARWRWFRKKKINLTEEELQKDLKRLEDTLCFMNLFIERK